MIKEIEIKNFGIFKGVHTIRLANDERDNITVITSVGGAGKTTIIQALLWCLNDRSCRYRYSSRSREENIINRAYLNEAVDTGDVSVSVKFILPGNRKEISVKKTMTAVGNVQAAGYKYAYEINEETVSADAFNTFVQRIMPEDNLLIFEFETGRCEAKSLIERYAKRLDVFEILAESNKIFRELYFRKGQFEIVVKENGVFLTSSKEETDDCSYCDLSDEDEQVVALSIFIAIVNLTLRHKYDRGLVVFDNAFMRFSEDRASKIIIDLLQILPQQIVMLTHVFHEKSFDLAQTANNRISKRIRIEPIDDYSNVNIIEQ